jgi:hypothetical protein
VAGTRLQITQKAQQRRVCGFHDRTRARSFISVTRVVVGLNALKPNALQKLSSVRGYSAPGGLQCSPGGSRRSFVQWCQA